MTGTNKQKKFNPALWRDHSANQRTYLSWMRAAIALMGFGSVILRLQTPPQETLNLGWLMGFVLSVAGLLTVIISTGYYFLVRRAIDQNTYEPATVRIISFSLTILLLGVGILYFLITEPDVGTEDFSHLNQ